MNRYIILILIAFSVAAGSCTGRKNKAEHKNIIPEKDLILILTEVHMADGLLSLPEIRYKFTQGDTLKSYIDIIEKLRLHQTSDGQDNEILFRKETQKAH